MFRSVLILLLISVSSVAQADLIELTFKFNGYVHYNKHATCCFEAGEAYGIDPDSRQFINTPGTVTVKFDSNASLFSDPITQNRTINAGLANEIQSFVTDTSSVQDFAVSDSLGLIDNFFSRIIAPDTPTSNVFTRTELYDFTSPAQETTLSKVVFFDKRLESTENSVDWTILGPNDYTLDSSHMSSSLDLFSSINEVFQAGSDSSVAGLFEETSRTLSSLVFLRLDYTDTESSSPYDGQEFGDRTYSRALGEQIEMSLELDRINGLSVERFFSSVSEPSYLVFSGLFALLLVQIRRRR